MKGGSKAQLVLIQTRVTPEVAKLLRAAAKTQRRSVASMVRVIVEHYIGGGRWHRRSPQLRGRAATFDGSA